ncbi:hypothetical protein L211DRAFT_839610 [Terfezia boudieri ATCC MYA-4762]|uniref:Uncharacterized protein n=1 Tax=Terfezia boudieri ATCC MYA-4762 TaxID=1051890 RepID=A0A3N4LI32_9PEZI|nr:hypothetical protein L211DRAFT_839610 [Terfezia boudieri ATCC MYA-4762]
MDLEFCFSYFSTSAINSFCPCFRNFVTYYPPSTHSTPSRPSYTLQSSSPSLQISYPWGHPQALESHLAPV